jgi:hypothetical protein
VVGNSSPDQRQKVIGGIDIVGKIARNKEDVTIAAFDSGKGKW